MIKKISCNQPTFRTVEFTPGFNIVLADRARESTRRDSRNGLGKTTLIEIIHFCLGASARRNQGLLVESLQGWDFALEIDLGGLSFTITRETDDPGKVYVEGDTGSWPIPLRNNEGRGWLKVYDWNLILGNYLFGLPIGAEQRPYAPSFRSLISYFARRGPDAFSTPFEHFRKQLEWDKQVNNAFLLGLAWENASDWQFLKDKENALASLKKAADIGVVQGFLGSVGELESQRVLLEEQVQREELELRQFHVHPRYREIEENANALTVEIHALSNNNLTDRRLLEFYENSLRSEQEPDGGEVVRLFQQAEVELPGLVRRRLEEVEAFHDRIIENRRQFLAAEIEKYRRMISIREERIKEKSDARAGLLQTLRAHGALEEYSSLQQLYTQSISRLQELRARLANLRGLEEGQSTIRIERGQLQQRARMDYDERHERWRKCITLFNENSQALYDAPGNLIIDLTPRGFNFDVEIARAQSQGVSHMKVFCYDLMLAQLWSTHQTRPGFLVHDSAIYDGVDERQVALALERAATESERLGFQYICTLNSDTLPLRELSEGFDLDRHVRLRLTDATPSGSLLGIRY